VNVSLKYSKKNSAKFLKFIEKQNFITWDKSGKEKFLGTPKNLENYPRKSEPPSVRYFKPGP